MKKQKQNTNIRDVISSKSKILTRIEKKKKFTHAGAPFLN